MVKKTIQHNRLLHQFIDEAEVALETAQSPEALLAVIESASALEGDLHFQPQDYGLYALLDGLLLISGLILFQKTAEGFPLFMMALALFIGVILFVRFRKRARKMGNLSEKIFFKDLLFDNQLSIVSPPDFTIEALLTRFHDFHRGNYSRKIEQVIQGEHLGHHASSSFPFHYYHFHYVDEHTDETKESDGSTSTKTTYRHYDRFGIVIPFQASLNPEQDSASDSDSDSASMSPKTENLQITESKALFGLNKSDYAPASLSFRKRFIVKTHNTHFAAKFLKPIIVELIEALTLHFSAITLEINEHNELLIAFTDKDLLAVPQRYSLAETALFLAEIKGISTPEKLTTLLKALENIRRETDNNFQ